MPPPPAPAHPGSPPSPVTGVVQAPHPQMVTGPGAPQQQAQMMYPVASYAVGVPMQGSYQVVGVPYQYVPVQYATYPQQPYAMQYPQQQYVVAPQQQVYYLPQQPQQQIYYVQR